MGSYRAMFQTSSVGSNLTTAYTTLSARTDGLPVQQPILSTRSQSNAGSPMSPQAEHRLESACVRHFASTRSRGTTPGDVTATPATTDGRIK